MAFMTFVAHSVSFSSSSNVPIKLEKKEMEDGGLIIELMF